jgi:putative ABC transport system ATP-binding protein
MKTGAILEVEGLTRSYASGNGFLTVIKAINFSLAPASTCAIVGPSGSGKTTLIGLCAGLDQPALRSAASTRMAGRKCGTTWSVLFFRRFNSSPR